MFFIKKLILYIYILKQLPLIGANMNEILSKALIVPIG